MSGNLFEPVLRVRCPVNTISYLYLFLAIVLEVLGTVCVEKSRGFNNILPSVFVFIFYAFSFTFLTLAVKKIDVSLAYAIWTGSACVLMAIIGKFWFKEPLNVLKTVSLVLIVAGVIGSGLSVRTEALIEKRSLSPKTGGVNKAVWRKGLEEQAMFEYKQISSNYYASIRFLNEKRRRIYLGLVLFMPGKTYKLTHKKTGRFKTLTGLGLYRDKQKIYLKVNYLTPVNTIKSYAYYDGALACPRLPLFKLLVATFSPKEWDIKYLDI